jgi:hypothetical protein
MFARLKGEAKLQPPDDGDKRAVSEIVDRFYVKGILRVPEEERLRTGRPVGSTVKGIPLHISGISNVKLDRKKVVAALDDVLRKIPKDFLSSDFISQISVAPIPTLIFSGSVGAFEHAQKEMMLDPMLFAESGTSAHKSLLWWYKVRRRDVVKKGREHNKYLEDMTDHFGPEDAYKFVVLHEAAHAMHEAFKGMRKNPTAKALARSSFLANSVTYRGTDSKDEWFAEHMALYLHNPDILKKRLPEAVPIMKRFLSEGKKILRKTKKQHLQNMRGAMV